MSETGFTQAVAINDAGQVLLKHWGSLQDETEAYLWQNGMVVRLGNFNAVALNNAGQVVGSAARPLPGAWLWQNGSIFDLGNLGGTDVTATAINDLGQVVGESSTASGASHAFIWDGGVMSDLNNLVPAQSGWDLTRATAINRAGQIVGYGRRDGRPSAFRLTLTS